MAQYITIIDYEYREKRRRFARKEKQERDNKKAKFSRGHCSVKHDEDKHLQYQMGLDLLEMGQLYIPTAIAEYPQEIQDKAKVRVVSKEETITKTKDKVLSKKRTAFGLQRKERVRKKCRTLEQFKQSLVN